MSYPEKAALGKSGITVSPIAWGMWRFTGDDVAAATARVEAALDAGVTLFDTADIYGFNGNSGFGDAESLLGRVFAGSPGLRGRMVLATKGGIRPPLPYDQSRAYLMEALDASLRRLGTERIDLYQVHRPDILTHPEDLAGTLDAMVASGKVRAVGVSNFTPDQCGALAGYLKAPLASVQPEFSPLHLNPLTNGLFDRAMAFDVAVLAWSPLAGGRLAAPDDERGRAVAALLDAKAEETGVDRAAATYSWIMAHPARPIPIVGTQNVARIARIGDALKPAWTRAEWYAVLQASMGEKLP